MARDYEYLRRWHERTGSYDYYIEDLVARAHEENAPANAIYLGRELDGKRKWVTVDDLRDGINHPMVRDKEVG